MLMNIRDHSIARFDIVKALAGVREEWAEAVGDDLLDTHASVGLLLTDLAQALGLTEQEQVEALGPALTEALLKI